jgi:hypothetical protein
MHIDFVGEKRQPPPDKFISVTVVVLHNRVHADVLNLSFKHDLGVCQPGVAFPFLDDPRIAGASQGPRTEVGADVERVAISPSGAGLGFR